MKTVAFGKNFHFIPMIFYAAYDWK